MVIGVDLLNRKDAVSMSEFRKGQKTIQTTVAESEEAENNGAIHKHECKSSGSAKGKKQPDPEANLGKKRNTKTGEFNRLSL